MSPASRTCIASVSVASLGERINAKKFQTRLVQWYVLTWEEEGDELVSKRDDLDYDVNSDSKDNELLKEWQIVLIDKVLEARLVSNGDRVERFIRLRLDLQVELADHRW